MTAPGRTGSMNSVGRVDPPLRQHANHFASGRETQCSPRRSGVDAAASRRNHLTRPQQKTEQPMLAILRATMKCSGQSARVWMKKGSTLLRWLQMITAPRPGVSGNLVGCFARHKNRTANFAEYHRMSCQASSGGDATRPIRNPPAPAPPPRAQLSIVAGTSRSSHDAPKLPNDKVLDSHEWAAQSTVGLSPLSMRGSPDVAWLDQ